MSNDTTGTAFGLVETGDGTKVTPDTMNLTDWLKGATPYRKTTHMYLDAALWEHCEDLKRQYANLDYQRAQQADGTIAVTEEPMSGKGIEARMQDIANELDDNLARLEQSKRRIVIQSIHGADDDRIGKLPDGTQKMLERVAATIVEPRFTAAEWGKVREAIGESQWDQLMVVWFEVQNSGTVGVDFSRPLSAHPATDKS